ALVLSATVLVIAWAAGRGARRDRLRAAGVLAAVVASHYLLDIVVHDSSMPVINHHGEVGLGVPMAAGVILESVLLLGGLAIYLGTTTARAPLGRFGPPLLTLALVGFNAYVAVSPAPEGVAGLAL